MKHKPTELIVITKAKALCDIVFEVTERSPKKFRYTLVDRMQNASLDIVSKLYRANETISNHKAIADFDRSISYYSEPKSDIDDNYRKQKLFELRLNRLSFSTKYASRRIGYEEDVISSLRMLDYLITIACKRECITKAQRDRIATELYEVSKLVHGLINADRKRYNY